MYEKSVTNIFAPFSILVPQVTPWAKVHQSWPWFTAVKTHMYQRAKFRPVLTTSLQDVCC